MNDFIPIFQTYLQVFSVKNYFKAALLCAFSFIPMKTFSQDIKLEEMLVIKGVCSKLIAKKAVWPCKDALFQMRYESGRTSIGFFSKPKNEINIVISFSGMDWQTTTQNSDRYEHNVGAVTTENGIIGAEGVCSVPTVLKPGAIFECKAIDYNGDVYRAKFNSSVSKPEIAFTKEGISK
ncbi:hypothetical protein N8206_04090 [Planktomarina temperata]|nr:hypothetical protein [Planktomarina temperata]